MTAERVIPDWVDRAVGLMHRHKIRQSDLAALVGQHRVHVNRILNGACPPTAATETIYMTAIDYLIDLRQKEKSCVPHSDQAERTQD